MTTQKTNNSKQGLPAGKGGRFRGLSIRSRIFLYLVVFLLVLVGILWLIQTVYFERFYEQYKRSAVISAGDVVAANIDNPQLSTLLDEIARQEEVNVIVELADGTRVTAGEEEKFSFLSRLPAQLIRMYKDQAISAGGTWFAPTFHVDPEDRGYDDKLFRGQVPKPREPDRNMVLVRTVSQENGETATVVLSTLMTPVTSTVSTIRQQLIMVTAVLLMVALLMSALIARRISTPIIATNRAAKALSQGKFDTPEKGANYREIAELNNTLAQAAVELAKVETLQRELIANISHDLRTPLTMIGGYAEAMRDIPGENTPENMQVIIDETKRLSTLVNAIMDYSKALAEQGVVKQPFDVTKSVEDILQRYQKLTQQDGYDIQFVHQGHVMALGDEEKLTQVIYNLINNAILYTGSDKKVQVVQEVSEAGITLSVVDTGKGIPPEEIPLIFDRYYRASHHKRAAIGTGLGLAIVKSILEKHEVPYGVESEMGKGSRFYFTLPEAP